MERRHWLRIIAEPYPNLAIRLTGLIGESEELIKIISKIIINVRAK